MYDKYPNYEKYIDLKTKGLRSDANRLAKDVVNDYKNHPSIEFIQYLCDEAEGQKINYIFWKEIVYPYVADKLETNAVAIDCLIKTIQNLYSSRECHESLGWVTEEELLRRLYKLDPSNLQVKSKLVAIIRSWLQYTIHEWPSGVLYGINGATLDECEEILEVVRELRELDGSTSALQLANDVEDKTLKYKQRLNKTR